MKRKKYTGDKCNCGGSVYVEQELCDYCQAPMIDVTVLGNERGEQIHVCGTCAAKLVGKRPQ